MKISPSQFRRAYNRFQKIHKDECGRPLESFADRNSMAFQWEGYKNSIPDRAMAILRPQRWSRASIGSGAILGRLIDAIQLPGNNLLQWEGRNGPKSRVHLPLIEAQNQLQKRRELEALLYDLYRRHRTNESVFDGIVQHCGRRYELLAYLFFVAAPETFLPIRTTTFEKALRELGVELHTAGNCGWENYQRFLAAMREVQKRLRAEGIADASLLDAHSFCWILARYKRSIAEQNRKPPKIRLAPFTGALQNAAPNGHFSPTDEANIRDMKKEAEKRQASGDIAEEAAMIAERDRLRRAGRPDLARKVKSVSNRPGLGYDIKSFEADRGDRFIEVKNVSKGNRFFLSEWEWLNSRERSNYWFYLVKGARVSCLRADQLKRTHLKPTEYLVSYSSRA